MAKRKFNRRKFDRKKMRKFLAKIGALSGGKKPENFNPLSNAPVFAKNKKDDPRARARARVGPPLLTYKKLGFKIKEL